MASKIYDEWKERVLNHLVDYKEKQLNIHESGTYDRGKRSVKHDHILPDGALNYLFSLEDEFWKNVVEDNNVKIHHLAHHLNSSQTMCLNFFYGLYHYKIFPLFLNKIEIENDDVKENGLIPEYIEKESGENTNFDFWIETKNNIQVFFEIKYTEDGFAKKTGARDKEKLWTEKYIPLCEKSLNLKYIEANEFLDKHFQIYRNVVRARKVDDNQKQSYVVFLTMKNNPSTLEEMEFVACKKYSQVQVIYWEDIIEWITQCSLTEECNEYFERFAKKYIYID